MSEQSDIQSQVENIQISLFQTKYISDLVIDKIRKVP